MFRCLKICGFTEYIFHLASSKTAKPCQMLSWHHSNKVSASVNNDAGLAAAQLSLAGFIRKVHCLSCCIEKEMHFLSFAESLGHLRVKIPLFCLFNIKGARALISIKMVVGPNYLYDCPLELLSMLFSLSGFSKALSPQEVYVRRIQYRQFRHHKRALH